MKKQIIISILLIVALFTITGCGKEEIVVGNWNIDLNAKELNMSKEAKSAFEKATKDFKDMKFDLVALLAEQVVSGKNYMYLVKGYEENEDDSYKILVIYNDLKNNASVSSVSDFDYIKYINENYENDSEELSGGWYVKSNNQDSVLEKNIQKIFDKATSTITGMSYQPIAVLGTQLVSGTNYAILCYGSASYDNMPEGIYLLTIYEDLDKNAEVMSQSYVDITEFNIRKD